MPHGFDALTHLDASPLRERLAEVRAEALAAGISGMLVAGWDPDGWEQVARVAEESGAALALGVHPWKATADLDAAALLDATRPPIVGEIGLDHFRAKGDVERALQRRVFRDQLAWARTHNRPVILHAVRAVPEVLHRIRKDGLPAAGGMIHGWTGAPELAEEAIASGLHLSVGPAILGRHPHKIVASVRAIPRDRLLLETDAPEQRIAGVPNPTPAALRVVAEAVARVWGQPTDQVLQRTGDTARALFQLTAPHRAR